MNLLKILITAVFALTAASAHAQTFLGCPERDYKCQLNAAMAAMKADPKNPENYYNVALVFQRVGAHEEAVESYSMYVAIPGLKKENLADGYNNRGISHRKLKRADLAAADFTRAFELVPTNPAFVANRGNANTDLKKYDAALADYAAAIKLNPRFAPAYSGRAHLYGYTSRHVEAIADFTKAIESDPKDPENYFNRAIMYRENREYPKSIADLDKYIPMISANPNYLADGYFNRGLAYAIQGRREQAISDFTKVVEIDPKRVNGYRARAMVYREMKKDDLAAADENRVKELTKP